MDGNVRADSRSRAGTVLRRGGWLLSGLAVLGACLALRWYWPSDSASAGPPPSPVKQATAVDRARAVPQAPPGAAVKAPKKNPVAALVNDEPITREELADECLVHYGADVLESMVNRTLILVSTKRRNIEITQEDVDAEIERMAGKFQMGKEQWLGLLQKERGITYARYAKDIIWPTLALQALAKDQLKVTRQEVDNAFESEFGPAVKVRLIALADPQKAQSVHAQAVAKPEEFGALAKKYSQDANSASAYGLIQPIRRHLGDANLEAAAFALKKGEISNIVKVDNLYVFVKCEEHLPAAKGVDRSKVEPHLVDALVERKLRDAANGVFEKLQNEAVVENIYNDPQKTKQMPGVAAVINGHKITVRELAEECMDRYGKDVLDGTVHRKMIEQAMRKRKLSVSDAEIEAEVVRAAKAMGKVDERGEADVAGWIEYVTSTEGISREVYLRDEVWPSVALKKLVAGSVRVTPEDMQRGFEANYGPKVRCRAIVLNNHRRAQEVWDKARESLAGGRERALKVFGDLAAEYSIEVGSRSLRGEVPPIQKHGGQPYLEKEAFSLNPENPLSGIVQVGGTYVILLYEGRTKPVDATFEEVKHYIHADILEKKLRMAMSQKFDELKDRSHVENFLTGEIKAVKKTAMGPAAAEVNPGVPLPRVFKPRPPQQR
ncbi:MAG: peptidylprolyl isomerase [Planctomycetota bacterium]|nr:MAG: peptidylprolyl isomerase [Planctomycetota bacterium]